MWDGGRKKWQGRKVLGCAINGKCSWPLHSVAITTPLILPPVPNTESKLRQRSETKMVKFFHREWEPLKEYENGNWWLHVKKIIDKKAPCMDLLTKIHPAVHAVISCITVSPMGLEKWQAEKRDRRTIPQWFIPNDTCQIPVYPILFSAFFHVRFQWALAKCSLSINEN